MLTTRKDDVPAAETHAREQRYAFASLLRRDPKVKLGPKAKALADELAGLAAADPMKFDSRLGDKDVQPIFASGALYFSPKEKP